MCEKTNSVVVLIVLYFAFLIPELETSPSRECPDIVNYRYEDPNVVADVTVPAPPQRGPVRLEIKYTVPNFAVQRSGGRVDLLDSNTSSKNLRYLVHFRTGDVTPKLVAVVVNEKVLCSAPRDYSSTMRLKTVSHNTTYVESKDSSHILAETSLYIPPSHSKRTTTTPFPVESYQSLTKDGDECGVPQQKPFQLIIGGHDTERGDWPWLVPMFHLPGLSFTCGSTIVSRRHVITAAHCVMKNGIEMRPREIVLKIGAFDLGRFRENYSKLENLQSIQVHEDYKRYTSANDLALLTTINPITFSEYVKPICLWGGDSDQGKIVNREAVVIGWGKTHDDPVSEIPQIINVPIVSLNECRASHNLWNRIASKNTICAGRRDGTGPCNGDSGGGLFLKEGNRWRLRGIISASVENDEKCGLGHFVLYTDLAMYAGWLRRRLN